MSLIICAIACHNTNCKGIVICHLQARVARNLLSFEWVHCFGLVCRLLVLYSCFWFLSMRWTTVSPFCKYLRKCFWFLWKYIGRPAGKKLFVRLRMNCVASLAVLGLDFRHGTLYLQIFCHFWMMVFRFHVPDGLFGVSFHFSRPLLCTCNDYIFFCFLVKFQYLAFCFTIL